MFVAFQLFVKIIANLIITKIFYSRSIPIMDVIMTVMINGHIQTANLS